jgi:hypothetical protein
LGLSFITFVFFLVIKLWEIFAKKFPNAFGGFSFLLARLPSTLAILLCVYQIGDMLFALSAEQNSNKIPVEQNIIIMSGLMGSSLILLRSPLRWAVFLILALLTAPLLHGLPVIQSPLVVAVMNADMKAAESILDKGVDSETKNLALYNAVRYRNFEMERLLVDRGADINARYGVNETLLMFMSTYKEAQFAIEKGADVNAKAENGNMALIEAAWRGNADVVRLLIDKGADINARGYNGNTALIFAVLDGHSEVEGQNGHPEVVRLLIDKGADVSLENKDELTALSLAQKQKLSDLVNILQKASK